MRAMLQFKTAPWLDPADADAYAAEAVRLAVPWQLGESERAMVLIEAPATSLDPRYLISSYDFKLSGLVYAPLVSADTPTLEPAMILVMLSRVDEYSAPHAPTAHGRRHWHAHAA